jgi:cobyrinic acid a,c-diamide synthase
MRALPGFVLAGTRSGCGKTSVALGLMAALVRRGLTVAPFKSGPDFIDPGLHALAAGRPSHNLDTWMLPPEAVRGVFARACADADLALVEGAMGLFDGRSPVGGEGSAADLAAFLGLPVVLVLDAASLSRSLAAEVQGYTRFDPALRFAGLVLNRVGSEAHARSLAETLAAFAPEAPLLGCLPRLEEAGLPSRHLGLVTAQDLPGALARIDLLAEACERNLDLDGLLARLPRLTPALPADPEPAPPCVRLGLARDAAFCFVYEENLRLLRAAGADIVEFSPLAERRLPPDLDGLYLPGGYPELSAFRLSQNAGLRREILAFARSGRPVLAECGGLLYLLERLVVDGQRFPMCGVFPFAGVMRPRRAALGYREVETTRPTLLGPAGTTLRGHEFHYSCLDPVPQGAATAFRVSGSRGPLPDEGYVADACLGTYVHLHFGSRPGAAASFVTACAAARAPVADRPACG